MLKTVTDRLIEEVANKLDHQIPSEKNKSSGTSSLRRNFLSITKKEAKKIARKKSKDLINKFTKYVD